MDKLGLDLSGLLYQQMKTFELLQESAKSEGADKTAKLLGELALAQRTMWIVFRLSRLRNRKGSLVELMNVIGQVVEGMEPVKGDEPAYENHTPDTGKGD